MKHEPALPGMSDPALQAAGEIAVRHIERTVSELGEQFPSLTPQRALYIIFGSVIGVAQNIGGRYETPLQALLDEIGNEPDESSA